MKNRFKKLLFVGLVVSLLTAGIGATTVFADSKTEERDKEAWNNSIMRKAVLTSAVRCYDRGFFKDGKGGNGLNSSDIVNNGLNSFAANSEAKVTVPYAFSDMSDVSSQTVSCKDLFFSHSSTHEDGKFSSILTLGGVVGSRDYADYSTTYETADKVANALGYKKSNEVVSEEYKVVFEWKNSHYSSGDSSDNMPATVGWVIQLSGGHIEITGPENDWQEPVFFQKEKDTESSNTLVKIFVAPRCSSNLTYENPGEATLKAIVKFPEIDNHNRQNLATIWGEFKKELYNNVSSVGNNGNLQCQLGEREYYLVDQVDNFTVGNTYSFDSLMSAKIAFLENMSGSSLHSVFDLQFNNQERFTYLFDSIKNYFYKGYIDPDSVFKCSTGGEYFDGLGGNYYAINVNASGTKQSGCGVLIDDSIVGGKSIAGFNISKEFDAKGEKRLDLKAVIDEINKLAEKIDEGSPVAPDQGSSEEPIAEEDPCYNAGIESMSWVLCPTLHNLEDAAVGISSMIDGMLTIDTRYYDLQGGTFTAWEYARDIANILMVIVFLAIIASQLTGYGIDNYGIKKILPKLVMMAIIVNLSYFICQLAIDLSNIIGNGVQNMLESIGRTIAGGDISSLSTFISGLAGWIMGGTAAAGTIASVAVPAIMVAEGGGAMAVIIVILAVLTILISVLIFFLSLGARTMIIILFSVLSPLAFVCYILPNTQKLFKNWWRVFQTALVIYPICGALSGASFVVRAIVFGRLSRGDTNGFHPAVAVVTMLMPFLPFYALPTLLKGALNTLGVVGGALSALGNGMKSGLSSTSHALQSSQAYKSAQEQARLNRTRFNAGIDKEGNVKKVSGFRRFISGGRNGMAAARSQYIADKKAETRKDYLMGDQAKTAIDAALMNQKKAAEAEGVEDYMTLFNDKTRNGEDEKALYALMDNKDYAENKSAQIAIARIALRRKDTASRYADRFNKGGFASEDIERGVAKEMATGKNSDILRGASPLSFAFSSAVNKGEVSASDYDGWLNSAYVDSDGKTVVDPKTGRTKTNAENALETYITKGSELSAVKGSDLKAIEKLIDGEGAPLAGTSIAQRIKAMADDLIDNKDKIPLDYSKAETLAKMSNKYESYSDKDGFKVVGGAEGDGTSIKVPHGQALAENQYSAPDPDSAANPNNNGSAGGTQFKKTEQFANTQNPNPAQNTNTNNGAQSNPDAGSGTG